MQRSEKPLCEELPLVLGNMTTGGLSKTVVETALFKPKSPKKACTSALIWFFVSSLSRAEGPNDISNT